MIFRKQIPNKVINTLVERYEDETLFLNKNNEYCEYKKLLISSRKITIDEFKKFIVKTCNDRFTSFDYYKANKNSNSNFQIDVKFKNFLYIKFSSFQNASTKFIDCISKTSLPFLIIDLRNNIGGDVDECAKIANFLLPNNCKIVNVEYRRKKVLYLSDEHFKKFEKIFVFVNEYVPISEMVLELTREAVKLGFKYDFHMGSFAVCNYSKMNSIVIGPDAQIYKCLLMIEETAFKVCDIDEYYQSFSLIDYVQTSIPQDCFGCKYLPMCFGGCKLTAFRKYNDKNKHVCNRAYLDKYMESYLKLYYGTLINDNITSRT